MFQQVSNTDPFKQHKYKTSDSVLHSLTVKNVYLTVKLNSSLNKSSLI